MTDQANALVARQPRVELQAWRDCAAILAITTDEHATQANTDRQVQIAQPRIAGRQRADMGSKRIVAIAPLLPIAKIVMAIDAIVNARQRNGPADTEPRGGHAELHQ